MGIGNNIRNIRKEKGMTLQQIADIMGCSPQLISQYESGKRQPKLETIEKIATALGCKVSDIRENAPKFFTSDEKGNIIKYGKPPKFTDRSISFEEAQAREKLNDTLDSIFSEEPSGLDREKIAKQINEILTSYNSLNGIGRETAVESIKELCYSNAMTESRLDTIYFNRIRKKIERGEDLTSEETEWKYAYLEKSLKTIGDDFGIFYSMLNRKGQEQAYIQIDQALEQIISLTKIPEYQKKPNEPPQE